MGELSTTKPISDIYIYRSFQNDVERAVIFFYLIQTSFSGSIGAGFRSSKIRNHAREYARTLERIRIIYKRLRNVVIESLDFREVIRRYDSENTLFYLDPPHLFYATEKDKEYYVEKFTDRDYMDLLNLLENIKGKFILKQNENPYVLEWAKKNKFEVIKAKIPKHSTKTKDKNKRPYMLVYLIHNSSSRRPRKSTRSLRQATTR